MPSAWEPVLADELSTRHHVTTRKRLQRRGISRPVIDRLCLRGPLEHVGNGVLAGPAGPRTFEQRLAVACALTGGVICFPAAGLDEHLSETIEDLWSVCQRTRTCGH